MRTIKSGSKGKKVKEMQELLLQIGYSLTIDGQFGNESEKAIKDFQFNHGLKPDGMVGDITWKALLVALPEIEVLRPGTQNDKVKELQQLLIKLNFKLSADGDFGKKTKKALMKFQAKAGLKKDGIAGPKTVMALREKVAQNEQVRPATGITHVSDDGIGQSKNTWDSISDTRIKTLHPLVRDRFMEFIVRAEKELNKKLRVTSALRTIKMQNKLYAQGRTKPGKIVTNAKGGKSYHNFGLAIDVVEIKNGKALWNNPEWDKIAELGKSLGLEWGGDWVSIKDKPHFQFSFGKSTKKLYSLYKSGKRDGEYVFLK